jgi:hypothetical protein
MGEEPRGRPSDRANKYLRNYVCKYLHRNVDT